MQAILDPVLPVRRVLSGLVCPSCKMPLDFSSEWECRNETLTFRSSGGIPDFLLPDSRSEINQFLESYSAVRLAEGWGSDSIDYYRALPWKDLNGLHTKIWRVRAAACRALMDHLSRLTHPLRILDAGAGNCWLAMKLAAEGHEVVAVDINIDDRDGLGVLSRFPASEVGNVHPARAEFAHLPFPNEFFDVVVFNASLHYSPSPVTTISMVEPLLKKDGLIYVIDSPIYSDSGSGNKMLVERREAILRRFGIKLPDQSEVGYLTHEMIGQLSGMRKARTIKTVPKPFAPLRRSLRTLLLGREPAAMDLIVLEPR